MSISDIIDGEDWVYIQVEKVACSSIRTALATHLNLDFHYDKVRAKMFKLIQPSEINNRFTFVFVRNPWDRLLSCWFEKVYYPGTQGNKESPLYWGMSTQTSFKDFCHWICHEGGGMYNCHATPQVEFLRDINPHFIGRMESMSYDWIVLQRKFGFPDLPHRNNYRKRRKHYSFYYDKSIIEQVGIYYKEDIERFEYKYEEV